MSTGLSSEDGKNVAHDVVPQKRLELTTESAQVRVLVQPEVRQAHDALQQSVLALQRPLVEVRQLQPRTTREGGAVAGAVAGEAGARVKGGRGNQRQRRISTSRSGACGRMSTGFQTLAVLHVDGAEWRVV